MLPSISKRSVNQSGDAAPRPSRQALVNIASDTAQAEPAKATANQQSHGPATSSEGATVTRLAVRGSHVRTPSNPTSNPPSSPLPPTPRGVLPKSPRSPTPNSGLMRCWGLYKQSGLIKKDSAFNIDRVLARLPDLDGKTAQEVHTALKDLITSLTPDEMESLNEANLMLALMTASGNDTSGILDADEEKLVPTLLEALIKLGVAANDATAVKSATASVDALHAAMLRASAPLTPTRPMIRSRTLKEEKKTRHADDVLEQASANKKKADKSRTAGRAERKGKEDETGIADGSASKKRKSEKNHKRTDVDRKRDAHKDSKHSGSKTRSSMPALSPAKHDDDLTDIRKTVLPLAPAITQANPSFASWAHYKACAAKAMPEYDAVVEQLLGALPPLAGMDLPTLGATLAAAAHSLPLKSFILLSKNPYALGALAGHAQLVDVDPGQIMPKMLQMMATLKVRERSLNLAEFRKELTALAQAIEASAAAQLLTPLKTKARSIDTITPLSEVSAKVGGREGQKSHEKKSGGSLRSSSPTIFYSSTTGSTKSGSPIDSPFNANEKSTHALRHPLALNIVLPKPRFPADDGLGETAALIEVPRRDKGGTRSNPTDVKAILTRKSAEQSTIDPPPNPEFDLFQGSPLPSPRKPIAHQELSQGMSPRKAGLEKSATVAMSFPSFGTLSEGAVGIEDVRKLEDELRINQLSLQKNFSDDAVSGLTSLIQAFKKIAATENGDIESLVKQALMNTTLTAGQRKALFEASKVCQKNAAIFGDGSALSIFVQLAGVILNRQRIEKLAARPKAPENDQ